LFTIGIRYRNRIGYDIESFRDFQIVIHFEIKLKFRKGFQFNFEMSKLRERGRKTLESVLSQPENVRKFEECIAKVSETDTGRGIHEESYTWFLYQICGEILKNRKNLKMVLMNIKNGRIGWNSQIYDEERARIAEHDEYIVCPIEVVEGVSQCGKCGSKKTFSMQKQVRGGDEPATTFCRCSQCDHTWAYSG
jgi:DNA-directed RNA polymerase subunit M/transcription elongation factor TFIIS